MAPMQSSDMRSNTNRFTSDLSALEVVRLLGIAEEENCFPGKNASIPGTEMKIIAIVANASIATTPHDRLAVPNIVVVNYATRGCSFHYFFQLFAMFPRNLLRCLYGTRLEVLIIMMIHVSICFHYEEFHSFRALPVLVVPVVV